MRLQCIFVAISLVAVSDAAYYDVTMLEALQKLHANILIDLVKTAGLDSIFTDLSSNVTLFMPNDRAFQRDLRNLGLDVDDLKKDMTELKRVLSYHVVPGRHLSKEFTNEKLFTAASGDQLRVNHYISNNRYFVDGAMIQSGNLETKNGVIHGVSHILFPFEGNAYEVIGNDTDLSTLKAAIDAAGLQAFLQDQNPITVFCPTNAAFASLGDLVTKVLADKKLLTAILTYHVIPGSLYRGGIHDGNLHTFDEQDKLEIDHHFNFDDLDGSSRFLKYDISVSNGVLHKISNVLAPQSVDDQIKNLQQTP